MLDDSLRMFCVPCVAVWAWIGAQAQNKPAPAKPAPTSIPTEADLSDALGRLAAARADYEAEVRRIGDSLVLAIDEAHAQARSVPNRDLMEKLLIDRQDYVQRGEWPVLVPIARSRTEWTNARIALFPLFEKAANVAARRGDDELDAWIADSLAAFQRTDDKAPWQNLLDKAVLGSGDRAWTRAGTSLMSPASGAAGGATNKLYFEIAPPPEYSILLLASRLEGDGALVLGCVDPTGQRFDLAVTEPKTAAADKKSAPLRVRANVQADRIQVDIDDQLVYLWRQGAEAPPESYAGQDDPPKLFLAADDERTRFGFASVELKCLKSTKASAATPSARPMRPTPKVTPPPEKTPDKAPEKPATTSTPPKTEPTTRPARPAADAAKMTTPEWAERLDPLPNPNVIADVELRAQIETSGYCWRVRDRTSGVEMLLVPAGSYTRGASEDDNESEADESPAHRIAISDPFYISRYEVQESEWRHVMEDGPRVVERGLVKGGVSWAEVGLFMTKLHGKRPPTKDRPRLPTEAEWEYACRAGSTSARYGEVHAVAWFSGTSQGIVQNAGGKEPNALGLFDMLGNVWEWCSDRYQIDEYMRLRTAGPITKDPGGPSTGDRWVIRGGSAFVAASACRASNREPNAQERSPDYGFRLVRNP